MELRPEHRLRSIVLRGLARRCARCGQGPLYSRWIHLHERCPECGLKYLENQGDPWFFQLVIDRVLFVLPIIAALFFGLHKASLTLFVVFCVAAVALFFYTTPHRYGVCVALDFYSRLRTGELAPPAPAKLRSPSEPTTGSGDTEVGRQRGEAPDPQL